MSEEDSHLQSRSWLERLTQAFSNNKEPSDLPDLREWLAQAHQRQIIDHETLLMIQGVLDISQLRVRDIMIPRSQMVVVYEDQSLEDFLPVMIESSHSRFPVMGDDEDKVLGILFAKDLLRFHKSLTEKSFVLHDIIRPAILVPESKRLDALLQEFKKTQQHMAIVVDEYGSVAGLVTIEDILEQIVGDIEDEFDIADEEYIKLLNGNRYAINALTPIEELNGYFNLAFDDTEYDTIGGLIAKTLGHLPKRGESVTINNIRFEVIHADSRRIRMLEANVNKKSPTTDIHED